MRMWRSGDFRCASKQDLTEFNNRLSGRYRKDGGMENVASGLFVKLKMDYYFVDGITEKEKQGIKALKGRLQNEMTPTLLKDNTIFIRFLRAREGNLDKATEMLRNHIEWRKLNDIDNIENYEPPEVFKYFPLAFLGFDEGGNSVSFADYGNADVRGILKSMKIEDVVKSIVKYFESDLIRLKQQSEKYGKSIDKWAYIFNFGNFSFASATNKKAVKFYTQIAKTYDANYPERLKVATFINVSPYFTLFLNLIKPLLSATTIKKFKIFGKEGWKEELLKVVDSDVLPAFLGGTRNEENGETICGHLIQNGYIVPQSYYFRSSERRLCSKPDIDKMVVARMSKNSVELDVKKAGDFIEWEFETETGAISFGLFMEVSGESGNSNLKEIISTQKVEAHIACETGTYRCEESGKYILQFDNSHSWTKRKEVYYRVEVVESSA